MVKVHVHNERPDEVIAYGLSLGTLTRITVENLDTMADDVREARATEFVSDGGSGATLPGAAEAGRRGAAVAVAHVAPVAGTSALGVGRVARAGRNGYRGPDAAAPSATAALGTDVSGAVDAAAEI